MPDPNLEMFLINEEQAAEALLCLARQCDQERGDLIALLNNISKGSVGRPHIQEAIEALHDEAVSARDCADALLHEI